MGMNCGIVGLPNVGKSTIFSALTSAPAEAANYPFCTIEPNVGVVHVPDERLEKIAKIVAPEKVIPAITEFVDIAGLVKGASKGEGLGNQFLGHIRQVERSATWSAVSKITTSSTLPGKWILFQISKLLTSNLLLRI